MSYKLHLKYHHILWGKIQYNYEERFIEFRSSEDNSGLTSFYLLDNKNCNIYRLHEKFTYKPGVCLDHERRQLDREQ